MKNVTSVATSQDFFLPARRQRSREAPPTRTFLLTPRAEPHSDNFTMLKNQRLLVVALVAVASQLTPARGGVAGTLRSLAGNGSCGYTGDGGPATAAQLCNPMGLVLDASGNVYIADKDNCVVRVVASTSNVISTVAGNGVCGYAGDGGPATAAQLNRPYAVALSPAGDLYIADTANNRIRKVALPSGTITTIAGCNVSDSGVDGVAATLASIYLPTSIAFNVTGVLYIATQSPTHYRLRWVTPDGVIESKKIGGFAGSDGSPYGGGPSFDVYPWGITFSSAGKLFMSLPSDWTVGGGSTSIGNVDNQILYIPTGIAFDSNDTLLIADTFHCRLCALSRSGIFWTVAGGAAGCGYGGDGQSAVAANFSRLYGVAVHPVTNDVYIADTGNSAVRVVTGPVPFPSGTPSASGTPSPSLTRRASLLQVLLPRVQLTP